jgi:hypothetical protein
LRNATIKPCGVAIAYLSGRRCGKQAVHTYLTSAASGNVCPVNEAAEQLAVGVRVGRADAGLCPAVSFSRRRTHCLPGRA